VKGTLVFRTKAAVGALHVPPHVQVSSTETGVIFGSIVYETGGTAESHVVVLNDIHIDIMDYISPAPCADVAFRNFWAEFEWENKVCTAVVHCCVCPSPGGAMMLQLHVAGETC
jgi:coatomer subunit beta